MTTQDQRSQDVIADFISKNPGMAHHELRAALRAVEPDRKKLHFGPNIQILVNQNRVLKIKVMGNEKYYSACNPDAAKMIRQCDDKDGKPLRIRADFTGAPAFITKTSTPMEWALKNILCA
jgi:hypothetical protein